MLTESVFDELASRGGGIRAPQRVVSVEVTKKDEGGGKLRDEVVKAGWLNVGVGREIDIAESESFVEGDRNTDGLKVGVHTNRAVWDIVSNENGDATTGPVSIHLMFVIASKVVKGVMVGGFQESFL